ncbi:MAG: Ig domain protein group 2 domain protein [Gemmatimonadetes bacterium]|nr:Ig domain protein group 2 domain protein [Gemmatimonadota bacterium]
MIFMPQGRSAVATLVAAGTIVFAIACGESTSGVPTPVVSPVPHNVVAHMRCKADVAAQSFACGPEGSAPDGVNALADPHVVGGQGVYVRLTSSGVVYSAGSSTYSFNVTVQNLSTNAMASSDGATRHANGVVVFFADGPTVTGGAGTMSIANATGQGTFTASNQNYFQYGGSIGGVDQSELGADGILASGEVSAAKSWTFNMPATITTFEFTVYVSTETPTVAATQTAAPQVSSITPATLVPGGAATLTGVNFNATAASNTVFIGGQRATVTGGTTTSLQVTVPCARSGIANVNVTSGSLQGANFGHPLQVTQRTLAAGESIVLGTALDSYCNELPATGGAARFVVSIFSDNTSPSSNAPMQFSGDAGVSVASQFRAGPLATESLNAPTISPTAASDRRHGALLDANASQYTHLRSRFGTTASVRSRARIGQSRYEMDPAPTRQFRLSNLNATAPNNTCNSFYVIDATRKYLGATVAIYEDNATPDAFKADLNAAVAAAYAKLGSQFNNDVEPLIRNNFGDLLRRDAVTDNDGVVSIVISPRLNTSFSGVAGFSTTCDQFPNDDASAPAAGGPYTGSAGSTNGASNFGQLVYLYEPVTAGSGFSANTVDNWLRTVSAKVVHESKHVASYSARVANNAPTYEASWLEEGTARIAEEMWGRLIVDAQSWKGDVGYGSFSNPISVYCDVRPSGFAECAANPRRPTLTVQTHFTSLYTELFGTNARLLSPFGPTASDNASYFWGVSWSLLRHANDRYGTSEAAFFTALTQSSTSGVPNLTTVAGVGLDDLVGRWALALYADNFGGAANANADIQFASWNFRSIYAGLNADFPATYTLPYPLVPQARTFGAFSPVGITTLRGGGVLWYELTGTSSQSQLLRLEANGGGLPTTNLRMAVMRLQ